MFRVYLKTKDEAQIYLFRQDQAFGQYSDTMIPDEFKDINTFEEITEKENFLAIGGILKTNIRIITVVAKKKDVSILKTKSAVWTDTDRTYEFHLTSEIMNLGYVLVQAFKRGLISEVEKFWDLIKEPTSKPLLDWMDKILYLEPDNSYVDFKGVNKNILPQVVEDTELNRTRHSSLSSLNKE